MGLSESTVWLHEGLSSYEQVRKGYEAGLLDDIFGPFGSSGLAGRQSGAEPNLVKEGHLLASEDGSRLSLILSLSNVRFERFSRL